MTAVSRELPEKQRQSPAIAAGTAASQELLHHLNQNPETRLLTAAEMAKYADRNGNWPEESAQLHGLIALNHDGKTFHPAFQIDPAQRATRDWVLPMVSLMRDA